MWEKLWEVDGCWCTLEDGNLGEMDSPVPATAENLHPLCLHSLDISAWGQEDTVGSLDLSCIWFVAGKGY